jgi:hypothetical protein
MRLVLLLREGILVFAIPMTWFEGSLCFALYILYLIFHRIAFSSIYCFTYYTSLYLVEYAYHYARLSRNEM